MNRSRILVFVLVLASTGAACGGTDAGGESSTTTPIPTTSNPTTSTTAATTTTTQPPTTTTSTVAPTTTTVEPTMNWEFVGPGLFPVAVLIDPGEEPHEVYVYDLAVGTTDTSSMGNGLSIEQSIDGVASANLENRTVQEITSTVVSADEMGFVVEQTLGPSTIEANDPATQAALETAYSQLEGLTTHTLLSPQGVTLATETSEFPPELSQLAQGLGGGAAPLPTDPFGVGAVWESTATIEVAGTTFIQTSVVKVVDIDDTVLTVEMDWTQTLGPDGFVIPGVETIDFELFTIGVGTAIWDLGLPFPVEANTSGEQTLNATLAANGEEAVLNQATLVTFEIK